MPRKTLISSDIEPVPRSRAPKGVDSARRLHVALTPSEREELERRASEQDRTVSAMARIYLVRGMRACGDCDFVEDGSLPWNGIDERRKADRRADATNPTKGGAQPHSD